MRRIVFLVSLTLAISCVVVYFTSLSPVSNAQDSSKQDRKVEKIQRGRGKRMAEDKAGIQRLKNKTAGAAEVKSNDATGAARFINFAKGKKGDLSSLGKTADAKTKSKEFFNEFGSLFGIKDNDVELRFDSENVDVQGDTHQTFKQFYKGVPVFAGVMKTHFDKDAELNAVNGNAVPEIEVDTNPSVDLQSAIDTATALVVEQKGQQLLTAKNSNLYVYRTGLAENVPGDDYLVYEIEVTNGSDVREFVYVDAHSNKIVDQITGIYDALNRRAFNGNGSTLATPPNYTNGVTFWVEGQALPTGNAEADNMITSSKETYDFYKNAFGRDSFGNTGNRMDSIFNRGNACPNASWNGTFISFCPGLTVDDVTAHEWSHAFTQYTHGLIYAYQPGALNEAYSDIFGETVDRINSRDNIGNSGTDSARNADSCSTLSPASPRFIINSPAAIAGPYAMGRANFGPGYTPAGVTGNVVIAQDVDEDGAATANTTTDACSPLTNAAAVAGKIALIDRGVCGFKLKTKNAQDAGAIGVIIANIATSANSVGTMADDATITTPITIPAIQVLKSTGDAIRGQLGVGVNVTIKSTTNTDASTRWLLGEDSTAIGLTGALRDMYNPTCYANPGKVSDNLFYVCDAYSTTTGDQGGVHTNSGIPNHAYALLVDGGTYNGQTVNGIGLTKAAHIYFRAESVYQVPNSNFTDHADSVEQAAADLIASGTNLADLKTGLPSGEIVTANDLEQVKKAMLAVEMRKAPTNCATNFVLDKNTPAEAVYTVPRTFLSEDFETGATNWSVSSEFVASNAAIRSWGLTTAPERPGTAVYITDPNYTCSTTSSAYRNQTGVMHLESPAFQLPGDAIGTTLSFDHRVASEFGYDGGQLMISVNGGAFVQIPETAFAFNQYNTTFLSSTGSTNPRAGQKAFSGTDDRTKLLEGSWGKSIVDLTGIATPGQTIKLRWDFSNDNCGGQSIFGYGWFVDNIKVYGGLADTDGDGVADAQDNCPVNANPNQADNDQDGIGDVCDTDDDNDGVLDTVDNCPFTANPDQADFDHDGIGDTCDSDDDGDGVADGIDQCPSTITSQTVIIGTGKKSNTGVPNKILPSGCSLQEKIDACKVGVKNNGGYVSAVSNLTDQWVIQGIITIAQKDAIQSAVAQDK